jgi:hypothetical protein
MAVFKESVPFFPSRSLDGSLRSKFPTLAAEMTSQLKTLGRGECLTITAETGKPEELERKRAHWGLVARRAGLPVVTRITVSGSGDKVLRIWRKPE